VGFSRPKAERSSAAETQHSDGCDSSASKRLLLPIRCAPEALPTTPHQPPHGATWRVLNRAGDAEIPNGHRCRAPRAYELDSPTRPTDALRVAGAPPVTRRHERREIGESRGWQRRSWPIGQLALWGHPASKQSSHIFVLGGGESVRSSAGVGPPSRAGECTGALTRPAAAGGGGTWSDQKLTMPG